MGGGRIEGEKPVRQQGQEGGNQLEDADPHRIHRLAAITLPHELPAELVRRVAFAVQDEGIVIHVKIRPERPSHGQQSYQKYPEKRSPQQQEQWGYRNGTVGNDAHSERLSLVSIISTFIAGFCEFSPAAAPGPPVRASGRHPRDDGAGQETAGLVQR